MPDWRPVIATGPIIPLIQVRSTNPRALDLSDRRGYAVNHATEGLDLRRNETFVCAIGRGLAGIALAAMLWVAPLATATAAPKGSERAYDVRLMRLSEILGAVHYLRELCDGKDGMRWRNAVNRTD